MSYRHGDRKVEPSRREAGRLDVIRWEPRPEGARFVLRLGDRIVEGHGARSDEGWEIWIDGESLHCPRVVSADEAEDGRPRLGPWRTPFACRLVDVLVRPGERVAAGAPLLRIESMKMEQVVAAPAPCMVSSVEGHAGESLPRGKVILTLAPLPGDDDEKRS